MVQGLPEGYYNNWDYSGTRAFIARSDLAPELKDALVAMCIEGKWYSPRETLMVLDLNRRALSTLRPH